MTVTIIVIVFALIIYFLTRQKAKPTLTDKNSKNAYSDPYKKENDLVKVSNKTVGNTTTFTIDLDEKELLNRIKSGKREKSVEDIAGFYGSEKYSANSKYCVIYGDGYFENEKWKNGNLALIKGTQLTFKKKIQRPNDCYVSNNGIVICCDWLNSEELIGKFLIFGSTGEQLFVKKTTANLGACGISDNGKIALFETYSSETEDGDKIFIIDVGAKAIVSSFDRPSAFNNVIIDTTEKRIKLIDNRKFIFEIDFEGNQTNQAEYENQIMTQGSVYDRLCLYSSKPDEVKFSDRVYKEILENALIDNDASYSFGKDRVFRMMGEYFEANGDIQRTIDNWEKAIEINPKVGVKRKLDTLRKKKLYTNGYTKLDT
jgi:hypothetical protein